MNHTKCLERGSLSSLSNIFVFTVRGPNSFCMVYTLSRSWIFFFRAFFYMLYYNADKMDDLNLRHLIRSYTLNLFLHLPGAFILRHLFMLYDVFELYHEYRTMQLYNSLLIISCRHVLMQWSVLYCMNFMRHWKLHNLLIAGKIFLIMMTALRLMIIFLDLEFYLCTSLFL